LPPLVAFPRRALTARLQLGSGVVATPFWIREKSGEIKRGVVGSVG
jgi:hypothetical protein